MKKLIFAALASLAVSPAAAGSSDAAFIKQLDDIAITVNGIDGKSAFTKAVLLQRKYQLADQMRKIELDLVDHNHGLMRTVNRVRHAFQDNACRFSLSVEQVLKIARDVIVAEMYDFRNTPAWIAFSAPCPWYAVTNPGEEHFRLVLSLQRDIDAQALALSSLAAEAAAVEASIAAIK